MGAEIKVEGDKVTVILLAKPLVLAPAAGDVPAKTIAALTLNFDALTPLDIKFCRREAAAAAGEPIMIPVLDDGFHEQLGARACGIPVEALNRLSGTDYLRVTERVRSFLLSLD